MAYFSNGSEGEMYEAEFCSKCIHQGDPYEGPGCPIWGAHLLYNYDQLDDGNESIKSILNMFIPEREDGFADKCNMFVPKAPPA